MIHTKIGAGPKKLDDPEQTLLQPDGTPKKLATTIKTETTETET